MSEENPFGISKLDLLELAANKLVDQYSDEESLSTMVRERINTRIETILKEQAMQKIDKIIMDEMMRLMTVEIHPVDVWGDKTGEPTTLKAAIAQKAKIFWSEVVNEEGKPASYGGRPRHEWIYKKIAADSFKEAISQDVINIVGAFKDALVTDMTESLKTHVNSLIRVKTKNS